ncbi:MAG: tRNA (cytidine(34)-2'-O)-methyltransferase [Firmicutes bacterium ADurb.Bin248]|nr:MAG: tRNA (cytidine(34)-2'-O)-methyltransferase [Firmicutes bacterium ADurb.Bin248]
MFNIVLVEPEIPENTGNIARTCSVTGARLHLVRPLGFSVDDRHLKRAGLDYWKYLDIAYYDSFAQVEAAHPDARFFLTSTHAARSHTSRLW